MPFVSRGPDDPRSLVYNSARWRRGTRPICLERDGHECVRCHRAAKSVHHKDDILTLIDQGRDPYDPDECETLCASCHGRVDAARASRPAPVTKPAPNRFMTTVVSPKT